MSVSAIQLRTVLPNLGDADLSLEDQARCVLHFLLDRFGDSEHPQISLDDPLRCPNCDAWAESLLGPYCSESCRDQAAFVRQFRAAIANGSILAAEKQTVFGERLWWLLGGGLPLRESRIPESAKRQVTKRSAGKCEICGVSMSTVENFGSGCNRPLHLRAVCPVCSRTKGFGDLEFSQTTQVVKLLREFAKRIDTANPLRQCDDAHAWDWRAFMAKRRNRET